MFEGRRDKPNLILLGTKTLVSGGTRLACFATGRQEIGEDKRMRKVILTMWITLDGFIAGPNEEMNWITDIFDDEMGKYEDDLVSSADTLFLGRMTYRSFTGSWPKVPDNPKVPEAERERESTLAN